MNPPLLPLLEPWIRAQSWDGRRIRWIRKGIPQGSPLSPVLANIMLTPFDRAIESSEWPLVRYADYLLTFLKEPGAGAAVSRIETHLAELGLGLNAAKTRPASFEEGFHFLGAWFTGHLIYQPWKGGVVFHAPPMPARLQHAWRDRHPGRPKSRPPARSLCCADGRPIS